MAKTPIGVLGGAVGGAAGNLLGRRKEKRGLENSQLEREFNDMNFDPNRAREDALTRNFRGNFLQNVNGADPQALLGLNTGRGGATGDQGGAGMPAIYAKIMQSLTSGVNPDLVAGMGDLSSVPGLDLGEGRIQNDYKRAEFKGGNFLDTILGGVAGAGNAASSF